MKKYLRGVVLLILMASAAALSVIAKPTVELARREHIDLEAMVPDAFGAWRLDPSVVPIAPSPEVQATLDKAYDQTLSRTYIDAEGRRVMLSVAYGGRQNEAMQMHRPEICYPAQGFQVLEAGTDTLLPTAFGALPVRRLVAGAGTRIEPITYWLIVADQRTRFGISHRLMTLKYGLTGQIPDGMLIRVSSVGRDTEQQYQLHQVFIDAMLASLSPYARQKLLGEQVGS